jgi:glycosyltransferase involved in cell wall biosynthesis
VRLVWVSHRAELGGAELALVEGVKVLAQRGHDIHVVMPMEGPLRDRLAPWSEVHVLPHNPWVGQPVSTPTLMRWAAYNLLRSIPELVRLAQRTRPDLIATNTITAPIGGFAARRARIPHVWFVREFGSRHHGMRYFIGRRPTFFAMRHTSELVVVTSEALRRWCASWRPPQQISVVPEAVEVAEVVTRQPTTGTRFNLVLVGAMRPGKGQVDAVTAVAKLVSRGRDVRLDLVGSGPPDYEEWLAKQVRSLGLQDRVALIGFSADPLSLVADSDVALMCSRSEGFGRVTVEAMKLGKPVIGAASGATPELVLDGRNGLVYRTGDADDLARCVDELYHDRDRARALGQYGKAWASQRFNLERHGDRLEAALNAAYSAGCRRTVSRGRPG